jgi:aurora kinase
MVATTRAMKKAKEAFLQKVQHRRNSNDWSMEDFEVLENLGKGGFAKVMKARDKDTGYIVALKIQKVDDNSFFKHYVPRELHIHESLCHRGIVSMFGHFSDSYDKSMFGHFSHLYDKLSVVMILEYCLRAVWDILKGGRICEKDAARFVSDISKGLEYLHSKSILHRDIKPQNILISQEGKAMIADFGISVVNHASRRQSFAGTRVYQAPECFNNVQEIKKGEAKTATGEDFYSHYDEMVDLWSLGVSLYEMLTNDLELLRPFLADAKTLYKDGSLGGELLAFPDFVSEEAEDLIRQLLKRRPGDRISLQNVQNHPWIKKYTHG